MAFGRISSVDTPDGYRPAKSGEHADMTLNGTGYVKLSSGSDASDDGRFDGGDVGDKFYNRTFNRDLEGDAKKKASDKLRGAEGDASKTDDGGRRFDGTKNSQRDGERGGDFGTRSSEFKNNVTGNKSDEENGTKAKAKGGFAKKGGPLVLILGILLVGWGGMYGLQNLMPISLVQNLGDTFDSIGVSQESRSTNFLKSQLSTHKRSCVRAKIFDADQFKITAKQRTKLSKVGIEVDDIDGITVMRFQGKVVTADPKINIDGSVDFDTAFKTNSDFRHAYIEGSANWRTAVGAWFDKTTTKILDKLGIKRNHGWPTSKSESDLATGGTRQQVDSVFEESKMSGELDGKLTQSEFSSETETDDSGNVTGRTISETGTETGGTGISKNLTKSEVQTKLENIANSKIAKAAGIASAMTNFGCSVMEAAGAIGLIVAAYESTQVVGVATKYLEGIQKGQIDDSGDAPINALSDTLTQDRTEEVSVAVNGDSDERIYEVTGSAMSTNSVTAVFDGTAADADDPMTASFNIWKHIKRGLIGVGINSDAYNACILAKMGAAAVDAVTDVLSLVACFVPPFVGCAAVIADAAISAGASLVIQEAVGVLVGFIVPTVVTMLARDIATDLLGESLGAAIVNGASTYISQNSKASGQGGASKSSLLVYYNEYDKYIANKRQYEREIRSPFDPTSQYTFLGSILLQLGTVVSVDSGIISTISRVGSVVGNSMSSLIPGASAYSNAQKVEDIAERTESSCDFVNAVGAMADEFCNALIVTDVKTLDSDSYDPAAVVDIVGDLADNFEPISGEKPDVPTIKKKSNLAKYIVYCGQRESTLGVPDQNIANAIAGGGGLGTDILGVTPVAGDLADIFNNSTLAINIGYITGESCVIGNDSATLNWEEEGKYYSRFIEDQRLAESMGLVETSAVTAFLEEYYEENPLDNSFEGILARKSGLTKENVIATLELMEYYNFLAEYNPTDYYPVPAVHEVDNIAFDFDNDNLDNVYILCVRVDGIFIDKRQFVTA